MGRNNKYKRTIGQNHSRRLGGIITAGACVPIILQSRLQKVKALIRTRSVMSSVVLGVQSGTPPLE